MENINSVIELKKAIQLLEDEQALKIELLKEQFFLTYESLKPVNLLKSTMKDVASSPWLIENVIGTALGLTTGYFSKKLVVGTSGNIIRKLFGSALQMGVTNLVANNSGGIITISQNLFYKIFQKKKSNTDSK